MPRFTSVCLAFLLFSSHLLVLPVCGEEKKVIVCSTTQVADFARNVVGDRMVVRCILAPGADPHLYQPTPNDARLVQSADLCLENGWHLEGNGWMGNLAKDARKPIVACTDGLEPLHIGEKKSGEHANDPHAWFSPLHAAGYVRNILAAVKQIDPPHAAEYDSRAELYLDQLRTLHLWIKRTVNQVPAQRRILVTSHDAFGYFCQAYAFQAAAPVGWSTGAEIGGGVTPERRGQTIESIRGFGVKAIFVESSVNPKLVREIAAEAGVQIGGELYSDSMGSSGTSGETYLGMMRENVLTIVSSLK